MISAIFVHLQTILSKSSITVAIFLKILSYPFFKSKFSLGYPKKDIDSWKFDHYLNSPNC